jgi:hypothetical protein
MNWFKIAKINIGYRSVNGGKSFGTEGNGIYIAKSIELAKFFGSDIVKVSYKNPTKPLIVYEEPLPLLSDIFPIFAPIEPTDSKWIKINKQAVKNAGYDAGVVANEVEKSTNENLGFNAATGEYVDMFEAGIVDPAKVERVAMQNAVSVASLLLTTEATVTDIKEDKPSMPSMPDMGMGGMPGMM